MKETTVASISISFLRRVLSYLKNLASHRSTSVPGNYSSRVSISKPTLNIKIKKEFDAYLSGSLPPLKLQPILIPAKHVRSINV